jgi:hypothetical protein
MHSGDQEPTLEPMEADTDMVADTDTAMVAWLLLDEAKKS